MSQIDPSYDYLNRQAGNTESSKSITITATETLFYQRLFEHTLSNDSEYLSTTYKVTGTKYYQEMSKILLTYI